MGEDNTCSRNTSKHPKTFVRPRHQSWAKYLQGSYPNSDVERLVTQCFKSVWVTVALHEGLTFPPTYGHLTSAPNTVHGQVVHWTLGALLYRTRFFPLRSLKENGEDQHIHHSIYHGKMTSTICTLTPKCLWVEPSISTVSYNPTIKPPMYN